MIKIGQNVFFEDYIKGMRIRPDCIKIYFKDKTAKCFYKTLEQELLKNKLKDLSFIQIGNDYLNPYNIKGFELIEDEYTEDEYLKIYFPDASAVTTNISQDGFEELIEFFENWEN